VTGLIDHLEAHLGQIGQGYRGDAFTPEGVTIARFGPDSPWTGASTLATVGLSRHHLARSGSRGLHQELLMHFTAAKEPSNAAGILFQVAAELIDRGHGLRRGEVVGPRESLFRRGKTTALYAAVPVYLPDSFAVCREANRTIVLTWLVPITTDEAEVVGKQGWRAFEDALVARDPDLTDIERDSIFL